MNSRNDPIKPVKKRGAKTTFFPPYVLILGLFSSSIVDSFLIHMPIFKSNLILLILGLGLAISFFGLAIYTLKIFSDNEENASPNSTQGQLFVGGSFRYSRNPVYLAIVLIQLSCGIAFNTWWYIISALISIPVLTFTAIIPEEKYLEKEFGKVYTEYKKTVRRWI